MVITFVKSMAEYTPTLLGSETTLLVVSLLHARPQFNESTSKRIYNALIDFLHENLDGPNGHSLPRIVCPHMEQAATSAFLNISESKSKQYKLAWRGILPTIITRAYQGTFPATFPAEMPTVFADHTTYNESLMLYPSYEVTGPFKNLDFPNVYYEPGLRTGNMYASFGCDDFHLLQRIVIIYHHGMKGFCAVEYANSSGKNSSQRTTEQLNHAIACQVRYKASSPAHHRHTRSHLRF